MSIEMKPLTAKHIFPLLSLIGKLDIKDDFVAIFSDAAKGPQDHKKKKKLTEKEIEARGISIAGDMIQKVLVNLPKVETDINNLLAELTGKTNKQVGELPIEEYGGLIVAFFKKPELQDLFKQLASFAK